VSPTAAIRSVLFFPGRCSKKIAIRLHGLRAPWTELSTLTGTGSLMEWLDDGTETGTPPTAGSVLQRFYRLSGQP
jgi:hypothetical protein